MARSHLLRLGLAVCAVAAIVALAPSAALAGQPSSQPYAPQDGWIDTADDDTCAVLQTGAVRCREGGDLGPGTGVDGEIAYATPASVGDYATAGTSGTVVNTERITLTAGDLGSG
jgi:hypothetical protein